MELTKEQKAIIGSTGNIKINAVAGSGKTTTLIEYSRSRPSNSKILYLAFNKSVKVEASRIFRERGIQNVTVETAHSLAHSKIVRKNGYRVHKGYNTHEIVEKIGIAGTGEKHYKYILANHVNKFATYFFNSDTNSIQNLNYLDVVASNDARIFVKNCYSHIEKYTRKLIGKMETGEIEVSHDFYLKKFQLSQPDLEYDYILFDEGQDASPAMLDIILKQKADKVIVGDTHQQIYRWRYAINSLEQVDFPIYHLST
jgi:superfamily I DNA/RNA helicase